MNFPTIFPVACHTDHIGSGSTFVAIQGNTYNGIDFIPLAIQKGATAVVVLHDAQLSVSTQQLITDAGVALKRVEHPRKVLAQLSAKALNYPAQKLSIIGITGTKGKTTTAFILEHILQSAGLKTALLSTVHNKIDQTVLPTDLTTNHPDYLHVFFDQCVKADVEYVVMEVTAQALSLDRVFGIEFDGVIFTNFDLEHSEFYPTIEDYFSAKCQIFSQVREGAPVFLNIDDEWCQKILKKQNYFTFGIQKSANIIARIKKSDSSGLHLHLATEDEACDVACPQLLGHFNAYNSVAAAGMAAARGVCLCNSKRALESFSGVPGRLQKYEVTHDIHYFIDYAHNPSSFVAVLSTLKLLYKHLIVVFGCGGERDKAKRPLMGKFASDYADGILITTDNPRSEDPRRIIDDIVSGIPQDYQSKVIIELNREQAIQKAYTLAQKNTAIALLGKGPDEYQLINTVKFPFSEKAIIQQLNK